MCDPQMCHLTMCHQGMCDPGRDMRLAAAMLLTAFGAQGASALLESRAEGRIAGKVPVALFDFRPDSAEGWKITKATLFLHVAKGTVGDLLRVAPIVAQ